MTDWTDDELREISDGKWDQTHLREDLAAALLRERENHKATSGKFQAAMTRMIADRDDWKRRAEEAEHFHDLYKARIAALEEALREVLSTIGPCREFVASGDGAMWTGSGRRRSRSRTGRPRGLNLPRFDDRSSDDAQGNAGYLGSAMPELRSAMPSLSRVEALGSGEAEDL